MTKTRRAIIAGTIRVCVGRRGLGQPRMSYFGGAAGRQGVDMRRVARAGERLLACLYSGHSRAHNEEGYAMRKGASAQAGKLLRGW